MLKLINGNIIAEKIKDDIVKEIVKLNNRPNLAIVLIGKREDSSLYVNLKEREAKKVGIDTHLYKCPENISENEALELISHLNKDPQIDGILVQLPLPKELNADKIISAINPEKDVDRFHPENLKILLSTCDHTHVMPPVFEVVLEILKEINFDIKNKNFCIISNSDIFGKSLGKVLECRGALATVVKSDADNLINKTKAADVLITAVGKKGCIKKEMIKNGAIIIDIGIIKEGKKVFGDVDFNSVKNKAAYITPVPGGVGPITITMAFKNTLALYKNKLKKGGNID